MSDLTSVTVRHRPFMDLFSDSVRFLGLAHIATAPPDLRTAGAKASILHCVFSLEAAINGILADLAYSPELKNTADRFQVLEKYEFALYHISERKLDRGSAVVQAVFQLLKVRNDYVHSKTQSKTGGYSKQADVIGFPHEEYDHIKLPKEPRRWNYSDGKVALQATDAFLTHYFLEMCGWTPTDTMTALLPAWETPSGPVRLFVEEHRAILLKARENMKIPFAFLDLNRPLDGFVTDRWGENKES